MTSFPWNGMSFTWRRESRLGFLLVLLLSSLVAQAGPLDPDFERLELALRLKPAQKEQYDVAVNATRRAILAVAMAGLQAKERVARELEKPRPDLNILYDIHEQMIEQNKPLFRDARTEWSKLFAMMDDEQAAIAKRYIEDRLNLLVPR
jgi:hypothetical protein